MSYKAKNSYYAITFYFQEPSNLPLNSQRNIQINLQQCDLSPKCFIQMVCASLCGVDNCFCTLVCMPRSLCVLCFTWLQDKFPVWDNEVEVALSIAALKSCYTCPLFIPGDLICFPYHQSRSKTLYSVCSFAVYADGSICLDILQNRWSPTYDVSSILTSIQVI